MNTKADHVRSILWRTLWNQTADRRNLRAQIADVQVLPDVLDRDLSDLHGTRRICGRSNEEVDVFQKTVGSQVVVVLTRKRDRAPSGLMELWFLGEFIQRQVGECRTKIKMQLLRKH